MTQAIPKRQTNSRFVGLVSLIVLWALFAFWQRSEHQHQSELIGETLSAQAESLSDAVNSSVQSHRWFGPFVQQQLPSTLEVLANAKNVVAIAVIVDDDASTIYSAGDLGQVDRDLDDGAHTVDQTLQLVSSFSMRSDPPMIHGLLIDSGEPSQTLSLKSFVVLDRTGTIAQMRREAFNRLLVFALGTLLLLAVALGWHFTVRLTQAEGAARLLRAETRHLRELGQAAAGLAHETRNPLGLIRGWTQRLVEAGLPNQDQQEQAETVLEECDRVTARINQFLAFARQPEVNLEAVEVDKLINELATLMQSDFEDRSITLNAAQLASQKPVLADREQFRQAVFNLLQNAIALAPEQSEITISVVDSRSGKRRLEIADQGPGVSEQIAESLFEPYVSDRPEGTGLGLSIVRRIAVAHEWEVGHRPVAEGGSVFWIDGISSAV